MGVLFFVTIGLAVPTGDRLATGSLAAARTLLAAAGKFAGFARESRHLDRAGARRVGVGMVPRGEIGILVAVTAFDVDPIGASRCTGLVPMAIATAMIGPLLLHRWFPVGPGTGEGRRTEPETTGALGRNEGWRERWSRALRQC